MTLLKDNNYKDINVALLSLEADIKNKITNFDTSEIDKQLAEINSRIDKINTSGGNNSSEEIEDINSKLNSNSNKIRNLEQNIGDIDTRIDGIEQKLSAIFSAENKVTDFNATTNSGIYYWVTDAANRPTDYGVLLVNKYDGGDSHSNLWINQVAYGTNNKIYFRQNINSSNWTEWKAVAFEGELNADTVDNYHASQLWRSDGATWNPGANVTMTPSGNGSEWSFDFRNKNGATGSFWQVWDENKNTLLQVNADDGKVSAPYGFVGNLSGKADTAGTADNAGTANYARNMYYQDLDLSALDKTKFYPLVGLSGLNFAEVAICSESGMGSAEYNQNRIHFDISTYGWSDTPFTLNIREYTCYENNEITIGCIGRGAHSGAWAIWLRGGIHYTCFSRDVDLSLKTSDYTYGDETYTVGTNYYGGSNSNVGVGFTPQSTITEGAYSSRPITAPRIKADYRMVIPIGAPSSLEDGCIWIER